MRITSITYQLPSRTETIWELKEFNPDWKAETLYEKTGIAKRYVSMPHETALTLGIQAGQKLLCDIDRQTIDGLIYVTQSPDSLIPSTSCLLHDKLGLSAQCLTLDINQGCSGFVYGLSVASSLLTSGCIERCLIICAETYTKYISKNDRTCRPIFSDGASAVLLEKNVPGSIGPFVFLTDGSGALNLCLLKDDRTSGVSWPVLFMDGPKVMLFTMSEVPRAVSALCMKAGLDIGDIDLFVFHQASKIVLDNFQRLLKIDNEKLMRNYQDIGNTVSATIPIALKQAEESGRLGSGMVVLLMGYGVGYSLAGCILRA